MTVSNDWALRSWILGFGPLARVEAPAQLAAQLVDELERTRARYPKASELVPYNPERQVSPLRRSARPRGCEPRTNSLRIRASPASAPLLPSFHHEQTIGTPGRHSVIWFYAKQGRHLRCEVRQLVDGDHFDLVITDADGSERVEHFDDSVSLTRRSSQLEAEWLDEGWDGPFGRDTDNAEC